MKERRIEEERKRGNEGATARIRGQDLHL